jgi:D-alanine-D-alanine ligase-like ATP-grasp enzyme
VVDGLKQAGYDARPVVLERDRLEGLPEGTEAVFIALHGGYGENGGVQADLDRLGVPYTGPGAAASRITIDKIATKREVEQAAVPTAPYEVLDARLSETPCRARWCEAAARRIERRHPGERHGVAGRAGGGACD